MNKMIHASVFVILVFLSSAFSQEDRVAIDGYHSCALSDRLKYRLMSCAFRACNDKAKLDMLIKSNGVFIRANRQVVRDVIDECILCASSEEYAAFRMELYAFRGGDGVLVIPDTIKSVAVERSRFFQKILVLVAARNGICIEEYPELTCRPLKVSYFDSAVIVNSVPKTLRMLAISDAVRSKVYLRTQAD